MANRLQGFETFREPAQPPAPIGAEHPSFTPPPEREQVLDAIVNTLTGTTTPSPEVARGEVDLAAHRVTGGTGLGFPFQQGGQLDIPAETESAIQPAAVGAVDVAAGGVPRAIRATGQAVQKYGPEMAERAMDVFEASPMTPQVKFAMAEAPPEIPGQISTRFPTAVKAGEDPMGHHLLSGVEALKREPKVFEHNVNLMAGYENFQRKGVRGAEAKAEQLIQHEVDNLLWLHDQTPPEIRERSRKWYDGANRIANEAAERNNTTTEAASAVYAALSPQKDWFMNVSLGDRVMGIMRKHQDQIWTPEMAATQNRIFPAGKNLVNDMLAQSIQGKRLADLDDPVEKAMWLRTFDETYNPRQHNIISPEGEYGTPALAGSGQPKMTGWGSLREIGTAIDVFENPSVENISRRMGGQHKVRNFYNNIYAPNSSRGEVTIDTHAVAAGLLQPFSGKDAAVLHNFGGGLKGKGGTKNSAFTGNKGTYGIHAEAYKRAAEQRGVLPREMQSITWEAVRGLFNNKSAPIKKASQQVWQRYKKGELTQPEAQEQIMKIAGGINAPDWYQ